MNKEFKNLVEAFDTDTVCQLIDSIPDLPIAFDMEDVIAVEVSGNEKTSNGLPYLLFEVGGDWEKPITVVAYIEKGVKKIFIPTESNIYNKIAKSAYGNNDDTDSEDLRKRLNSIGVTEECDADLLYDVEEIKKEFDAFITKKPYKYVLTKDRYDQLRAKYLSAVDEQVAEIEERKKQQSPFVMRIDLDLSGSPTAKSPKTIIESPVEKQFEKQFEKPVEKPDASDLDKLLKAISEFKKNHTIYPKNEYLILKTNTANPEVCVSGILWCWDKSAICIGDKLPTTKKELQEAIDKKLPIN